MRNRTKHAMALVVAFTVSAMVSFAANGADVPYDSYKSGAYPQPPSAYSWNGAYLGVLVGYGNADTDLRSTPGKFNFSADGILGGGMLGYNWQSDAFVVGLEGDLAAADLTGSQAFGANRVDASVDWMAGLRGRAGYLLSPQFLAFATLGYGWAKIDAPLAGPGGGSKDNTFGGLQVGGGVEVKLPGNWGARFDYLYTGLDEETLTYPGGRGVTLDPDLHQLRGGLTYKF